jgi:hypothetical protein
MTDTTANARPLPWTTEPTGAGSERCAWCGRDINHPALPCSATNGADAASVVTRPGYGDRCTWELRVRGLAEANAGVPS